MKNPGLYILLLLVLSAPIFGKVFTANKRISAGLENDSNVDESTDSAKTAQSMLLTVHSQFSADFWPIQLALNYSGAFQHYGVQAADKTIHEPSGVLQIQLRPRLYGGIQELIRIKRFSGNFKDYSLIHHQPFLQYFVTPTVSLQYQYQRQILDYSTLSYFNFKANLHSLTAGWQLNDTMKFTSRFWQKSTFYSREILTFENELDSQQIDINTGGLISLDWTPHRVLINFIYSYEHANSNQYGFDYSRHAISCIAGFLFEQFYFTALLAWQFKDYAYSDSLNPVYWDSETNENNQLVIELSRDLKSCCTAAMRLGWYRNESVFANLYYDKFLLTFRLITRLN